MGRVLRACLAGCAGGILGALVMFFGGVAIGEIAGISQAEGAYAMSLAFFWAPLGAVLGMAIGLWLALRRHR